MSAHSVGTGDSCGVTLTSLCYCNSRCTWTCRRILRELVILVVLLWRHGVTVTVTVLGPSPYLDKWAHSVGTCNSCGVTVALLCYCNCHCSWAVAVFGQVGASCRAWCYECIVNVLFSRAWCYECIVNVLFSIRMSENWWSMNILNFVFLDTVSNKLYYR